MSSDNTDPVVDALCAASRASGRKILPSREAIARVVEDLRSVLFPGHFGGADLSDTGLRFFIRARLDTARLGLVAQVRRGLAFTREGDGHDSDGSCERRAVEVTDALVARLPQIRALLETDVKAAFEGDPAARFVDEALFCYPGVTAIIHHRIAHELYALDVPLIPRIISELAHSATGVDIHPGARIGGSFFIDHGTGVVIGETAVIGERVRLYQGVTLGAKSFPLDEEGHPQKGLARHPIVENDVVIYAGATILGRVTIGRGSSIGGNVWLTRSVPPDSRVTQAQARSDVFEHGSGI